MIRLLMADILESPLAFELCEGGTCGEPKSDAKQNVSCEPSDSCAKGGCYCQLFQRKKDSADTVLWKVPRMNHDKEVKYKKDEFDYKCLCVKPILERDQTIGDTKYAMRFVLCVSKSCGLDTVMAPYSDNPLDPNSIKFRKEFKCSGACEGDCKCTLFRLQIRGGRGFDPKNAKWEYMAKETKQVAFDDDYIYHCFCLK
jgi:hypothetical protein